MRRLVAGTVVLAVVGALGVLSPGSPARAAISFDDVAASNQFATAIAWLGSEGITKGCNPAEGNTRFCPDEYVTRGQMAAFLVRAFGYSDGGSVDFVDDDGSVFEADIERLAAAGVTKGCNPAEGNTRFCPDEFVTRGQMAAFLYRGFGSPLLPGPPPTGWLYTEGNRILLPDGSRFHGRGVNIFDLRDAGVCGWTVPDVDEWIRRIDVLIDDWHVNFFRFDLVSWASNQVGGYTVVQWKDITEDPQYLADVKKIVDHIGTRPGVYVMVTMFDHPDHDAYELPTAASMPVYTKLAETFIDSPQVIYGVTNEPHGTSDAAVWDAMNTTVATLRAVEPDGGPHHLIAVQGTQDYARNLEYYVSHPITAGGGSNIIYETHAYNPPGDWQDLFIGPAETLPVIIGEFGPDGTYMKSIAVAQELMTTAEGLEIPYIGWSFSAQNGPVMLEGGTVDECLTENWPLVPTDWGQAIIDQLNNPW